MGCGLEKNHGDSSPRLVESAAKAPLASAYSNSTSITGPAVDLRISDSAAWRSWRSRAKRTREEDVCER